MTKINLNKKSEEQFFEITIQVRDKNGNPTGKTKTFGSDSATSFSGWYNKNNASKSKKNKKNRKKNNRNS
jgi:hypothetical protein